MPTYTDALPRNTWDKHGERVSILDYMLTISDPATAINAAIEFAAGERGGCALQIPVGTYIITSPIRVNKPNIVIYGEGDNSIIQRGADMPDNEAIFVVTASNVLFRDFLVDGMIVTPAGFWVGDPAFTFDPLDSALTKNSSFRVHTPGVAESLQKIRFERITIQHTGGYAIVFDATSQYIVGARVIDCRFQNNRPHLFGYSNPADSSYGAWTGGVLCEGDGQLSAMHDFLITGCLFLRCAGNCFWTHLYAFNRLHSDIRATNNDFLDIGRDGIMMGGVNGGIASNNTMRRIGYISIDDTTTASPRWINDPVYGGQWAVGIDTSGLTIGVNYVNNTLQSCNGGYFDLDGFSHGTIVGNKCRTPEPGEVDYDADQIGAPGWGGRISAGQSDWVYGLNTGNTSQTQQGGTGITIVGNQFQNMGRGAIDLYACRESLVSDNDIYAKAQPSSPPISIGNINYANLDVGRSRQISVTRNRFRYPAVSSAPCVFEYSFGQPFQPGEYNVVCGNVIFSETNNAFEFERSPDSSSNTARKYSSRWASHVEGGLLSAESSHAIQREGRSNESSSVLRWYDIEGQTAELHMQLQAYSRIANRTPLLNVSRNGETYTGAITTGDRTVTGIDDVVATGVTFGDNFMALSSFRYRDSDADLFPADVGLIKYVLGTPNKFQMSVTTTGGVRIWQDFAGGGGGSIGGSDTQIIYNREGAAVGDPNLRWFYNEQSLRVVGKLTPEQQLTATVLAKSGYIESEGGILVTPPTTGSPAWMGQWNSIQSPGGGAFTAGYAIAPFLNPQHGWVGGYMNIAPLGYANYPRALPSLANFGADTALLWASGLNTTVVPEPPSAIGLNTNTFINAAGGFLTMLTYWNSIQTPAGGMAAKGYRVGPYLSPQHGWIGGYIEIDKLDYANFPRVLPIRDAFTTEVLLWVSGTNETAVANENHVTGIMTNTFINAAVGFVTLSKNWNCIQAPIGGIRAQALHSERYVNLGSMSADPQANVNTPVNDTIDPGCIFYRSDMDTLRYWNGAVWRNISGGIGGSLLQYCIPYAADTTTLKTTSDLFWEESSRAMGITGIGINSPVSSGHSLPASSFRISNGRNDNGGYMLSTQGDALYISAGCAFDGTNWIAKTPNSAIVGVTGGGIAFYLNENRIPGTASGADEQVIIYRGGMKIRSTAQNALQVVNPQESVWGGAVMSSLGLNGQSNASQMRVSVGAVDNGGFLTCINNADFLISRGVTYSGGGWVAKHNTATIIHLADTSVGFYVNEGLGVGGGYSPSRRMYIGSAGMVLESGWFFMQNNTAIAMRDSGGTHRGIITLSSNNNLYIDNNANNNDIFIRPTNGRYIFCAEIGQAVHLAPSTNRTGWLGDTSFYWWDAYIVNVHAENLFLSGSVSFPTVNANGALYLNNTAWIHWKDTGGTDRGYITVWNDNNLYISNNQNPNDIIIRVNSNRYVFIEGSLTPHGQNVASLGTEDYRWLDLKVSYATVYGDIHVHNNGEIRGSLALGPAGVYGSYQSATLYLSENPGRDCLIEFHNAGNQEAFLRLARDIRAFDIGDTGGAGCYFRVLNPQRTSASVILSPNGNIATVGGIYLDNNRSIFMKDTGFNDRSVLSMGSDNSVYLSNQAGGHIFLNPNPGLWVIVGSGGGILPAGENTLSLGTTGWRWNHLHIQDIDCAGTCAGLVKTVHAAGWGALYGDIALQGTGNISITQNGNTIVINGSASGGVPSDFTCSSINATWYIQSARFQSPNSSWAVDGQGYCAGQRFDSTFGFRVPGIWAIDRGNFSASNLQISVDGTGWILGKTFGIYGVGFGRTETFEFLRSNGVPVTLTFNGGVLL